MSFGARIGLRRWSCPSPHQVRTLHQAKSAYDHVMRTSALTHSTEDTVKAITTILVAAISIFSAGASHAKVFAVFEGSDYHNILPTLLTDEPCHDGHPEIPGKRAILVLTNRDNATLEACWNYESIGTAKNAAVLVCEKQGGKRDGQVANGYGCYHIPKNAFTDPASLPRPAF